MTAVIRSIAKSRATSRAAWAVVGAAVLAEAIVIAASYGVERSSLERDANGLTATDGGSRPFSRSIEMPGLAAPEAVPAGSAGLDDDEEVIGVVAGGRPRAYRLRALEHPPWHIVNDVVGGVPVTVAHCDLSGCTRAYAGPAGSGPLDVSQAGLVEGEMILKAAGAAYFHRTGRPLDTSPGASPMPYPGHELTRTRWGEWVRRHPTTDVFAGLPGRGPGRDARRP
jgi:hypothetical protein